MIRETAGEPSLKENLSNLVAVRLKDEQAGNGPQTRARVTWQRKVPPAAAARGGGVNRRKLK